MRIVSERAESGFFIGEKLKRLPNCDIRFTGILLLGRWFFGFVTSHNHPVDPAPESADKHWMRQKSGQPPREPQP